MHIEPLLRRQLLQHFGEVVAIAVWIPGKIVRIIEVCGF